MNEITGTFTNIGALFEATKHNRLTGGRVYVYSGQENQAAEQTEASLLHEGETLEISDEYTSKKTLMDPNDAELFMIKQQAVDNKWFDATFASQDATFLIDRAKQIGSGNSKRSIDFETKLAALSASMIDFFANQSTWVIEVDEEEELRLFGQLKKAVEELGNQIATTGSANMNTLNSKITVKGLELRLNDVVQIQGAFKVAYQPLRNASFQESSAKASIVGLAQAVIADLSKKIPPDAGKKVLAIFNNHKMLNMNDDEYWLYSRTDPRLKDTFDLMEQTKKNGGSYLGKPLSPDDPGFHVDPYYNILSRYEGSSREETFNIFANIADDVDGFEKGFQKAMAKFRALTIEEMKAVGGSPTSTVYYKNCIDPLIKMVKDLGYKVSIDVYA